MSGLRRARTTGAPLGPQGLPLRIFKDQSAADLRLHLIRGPVDEERFDVLARGSLRGRGLGLEASIIGASHWLRIAVAPEAEAMESAAEHVLHEVFACEGAEPGVGGWRLATPALPPPVQVAHRLEPGFEYAFTSRVCEGTTAAHALSALADRIAATGPEEIGLHCEFPAPDASTPGEAPARTLLLAGFVAGVELHGPRTLHVETAHSYPTERCVVFSRTRLMAVGATESGGCSC